MWLLSTWNMASAAEKLNFKIHLNLINSNLKSHMGLVTTKLDNTSLDPFARYNQKY